MTCDSKKSKLAMLVTVGVITEMQGIIICSGDIGSLTHFLLSYLQLNLLVRESTRLIFSLMILRVELFECEVLVYECRYPVYD